MTGSVSVVGSDGPLKLGLSRAYQRLFEKLNVFGSVLYPMLTNVLPICA